MKNFKFNLPKLLKFITSRILFIIIGIALVIGIYSVQAAWNTKVNTGDSLTPTLWNDMVDKLINLEGRMATQEAKVDNKFGGAFWTQSSIPGGCVDPNPYTGSCSCPAGYNQGTQFAIWVGGCWPCKSLYCWK